MKAVQQGSKELVALLLDHGAFVGTIEVKKEPFTPLHETSRLGSDAICELILQRGANVNARDFLGRTPLHHAVKHKRLVVARSLVSARADIEARNIFQRTALHYAYRRNSAPLVKLLSLHRQVWTLQVSSESYVSHPETKVDKAPRRMVYLRMPARHKGDSGHTKHKPGRISPVRRHYEAG